jgi:hypothetical protein
VKISMTVQGHFTAYSKGSEVVKLFAVSSCSHLTHWVGNAIKLRGGGASCIYYFIWLWYHNIWVTLGSVRKNTFHTV